MKKICVLGNNSGRNAGDAAILDGLLADISALYPDVEYLVPTIKPSFVAESFPQYNVVPVSLMPWKLSLKILGLPVVTSTLRSDLVLVTDAILFDLKLHNPLHNYLYTLSYVLPLARRRGVPVILYNMSIGPVRTSKGKKCMERILRCADLVIVRDRDSEELVRGMGAYDDKLKIGADCALNVVPSSEERLSRIMGRESLFPDDRPAIGFNINSYIDAFVRGAGAGIGKAEFLRVMSSVIDKTIDTLDANAVLVVTQNMDLKITKELLSSCRRGNRIGLLVNGACSHGDIAKLLSLLDIFVGMRTHSLILATAMGTPVAGIVAYPKNRGYLRSIGMGDRLIEFRDFNEENLWRLVEQTWRDRAGLRKRLLPEIQREKTRARRSAELLKPYLS